eukprot:5259219-Pleurochrysis_carterae.AAC.1
MAASGATSYASSSPSISFASAGGRFSTGELPCESMMMLPGRHSTWLCSAAAPSAAARQRRWQRRERTLVAAKSAFL